MVLSHACEFYRLYALPGQVDHVTTSVAAVDVLYI